MPKTDSLSGATVADFTPKWDGDLENNIDGSLNDGPQRVQGYQKLADFMGDYPAGALFRQFGSLNAMNLLYYQAELCMLEKQLKIVSDRDRQSQDAYRQQYFQSYQYLSQGKTEAGNMDQRDNIHWNLVLRAREILAKYNGALLTQSQLAQLPRPRQETQNYVKHWSIDDGNDEYVFLTGADHEVYRHTRLSEMMAIYVREYEDAISTWLTERATYWYNKLLGHRFQKNLNGTSLASTSIYARKPVLHLVTFLAIGIASTVPIVSVTVLNAIEGTKERLGLMALFTIVFCILFGLFTGAKKTDLLAASAAFAAVQVVFISGDNCCKDT